MSEATDAEFRTLMARLSKLRLENKLLAEEIEASIHQLAGIQGTDSSKELDQACPSA